MKWGLQSETSGEADEASRKGSLSGEYEVNRVEEAGETTVLVETGVVVVTSNTQVLQLN